MLRHRKRKRCIVSTEEGAWMGVPPLLEKGLAWRDDLEQAWEGARGRGIPLVGAEITVLTLLAIFVAN